MSEAQPSPHPPHPAHPATSNRPSDTEFNHMAYEHAHAFDYTLRNRFLSQNFHEKFCKYCTIELGLDALTSAICSKILGQCLFAAPMVI